MATTEGILGGLLSGLGRGLEADGKAMREQKLAQLQRQWDQDDAATAHGYRMEESGQSAASGYANDAALLDQRHQYDLDLERAQTEGAIAVNAANGDASGLDANDKRLMDEVIEQFTGTDGVVDNQGAAQRLRDMGEDDLADLIMPPGSSGVSYADARDQATAEADERSSMWDDEAEEFPEDGSRDKFIERRARELMAGNTAPASTGGGSAPTESGAAPTAGAIPPAPATAAEREVGKVYLSPSGVKGRWTGTGWEIVQ